MIKPKNVTYKITSLSTPLQIVDLDDVDFIVNLEQYGNYLKKHR